MSNISGKVIVVTGATSGLGRHIVEDLVGQGAHVVAHGRDRAKLAQLAEDLGARAPDGQVQTLQADLADLAQVDGLASDLLERLDRVDVLVNNAGIGFGSPGSGREINAQGIELRFAVNYLAGYHLTRRLLPLVVASAPARVVNVASIGQEPLDLDDPMLEGGYTGSVAYRRSKLAQVMFTIDLAAELEGQGVTVNSLHPATFMNTAMVYEAGGSPITTVEQGAEATMRLIASDEVAGVTGEFFDGQAPAQPHHQAYDQTVRSQLRRLSDELVASALS